MKKSIKTSPLPCAASIACGGAASFTLLCTIAGIFALAATPALAQSVTEQNTPLESCWSVANDPDGDGYGWITFYENNPYSCIVDENTRPKPLFKLTNGVIEPVNLIRTFWDANVDFANKEIECQTVTTTPAMEWQAGPVFTIRHEPVYDVYPYRGEYEITYTTWGTEKTEKNLWRAEYGSYHGHSHYYTPDDAVSFNPGFYGEQIEIDGQQGMRFYGGGSGMEGVVNGDNYRDCKDTSGLPFGPTGHWDRPPTSITNIPDIPPLNPGPSNDEQPQIINKTDGELVELQSFSWNVKEDLLFKPTLCEDNSWNGADFDPFYYGYDQWIFMPSLTDPNRGNLYLKPLNRNMRFQGEWWIEDGELNTNLNFPTTAKWYEKTTGWFGDNTGMTLWYNENEIDVCYRTGADLTAAGPVMPSQNCDYSNPDADGWGWNSILGRRCPPVITATVNETTPAILTTTTEPANTEPTTPETVVVEPETTVTPTGSENNPAETGNGVANNNPATITADSPPGNTTTSISDGVSADTSNSSGGGSLGISITLFTAIAFYSRRRLKSDKQLRLNRAW